VGSEMCNKRQRLVGHFVFPPKRCPQAGAARAAFAPALRGPLNRPLLVLLRRWPLPRSDPLAW